MRKVSGIMREDYQPRVIDRVMFGILSGVLLLNGAYLVGPWYLENDSEGKAPLYNLFDNSLAVTIFGYLVLLAGLGLLFATVAKNDVKHYTNVVSTALLAGFLLRVYSLIGVILTIESWRPPSYLSHLATVVMLGAYWVWVKVVVRPTQ